MTLQIALRYHLYLRLTSLQCFLDHVVSPPGSRSPPTKSYRQRRVTFGNIFRAVCAACFGCLALARFNTVSEAFFPGPAAELFARLPAAIETLQGRLGSDEFLAME